MLFIVQVSSRDLENNETVLQGLVQSQYFQSALSHEALWWC